MLILGIETSCDETSVAILRDGDIIISKTYSQLEHSSYGGVVPELASRAHLQKIDRLTVEILRQSSINLSQIDLVAVTDSPGLAGALLVGVSFAQGLAEGHGLKVTGVHHLEGHICAALIEHDIAFPFLALVVSGGHTALYRVDSIGAYGIVGQTVDDAAGEAFDKVGKLVGFAYPAGREIDMAASSCDTTDGLTFPIARPGTSPYDFSFSGLKTAVKYHLAGKDQAYIDTNRNRICRAFQEAVVEALVRTTAAAAGARNLDTVVCTGGVAANGMLRKRLTAQFGTRAFYPSIALCTDNAAMIARAGYERAKLGLTRAPSMSASRELS